MFAGDLATTAIGPDGFERPLTGTEKHPAHARGGFAACLGRRKLGWSPKAMACFSSTDRAKQGCPEFDGWTCRFMAPTRAAPVRMQRCTGASPCRLLHAPRGSSREEALAHLRARLAYHLHYWPDLDRADSSVDCGGPGRVALGGGFELVLSCDLVIAAASAQFGFPEASLGLTTLTAGVTRVSSSNGIAISPGPGHELG